MAITTTNATRYINESFSFFKNKKGQNVVLYNHKAHPTRQFTLTFVNTKDNQYKYWSINVDPVEEDIYVNYASLNSIKEQGQDLDFSCLIYDGNLFGTRVINAINKKLKSGYELICVDCDNIIHKTYNISLFEFKQKNPPKPAGPKVKRLNPKDCMLEIW